MANKKNSPIYNYNNFSSYNVKAGGSKNTAEGFSMRSGNKPNVSSFFRNDPLADVKKILEEALNEGSEETIKTKKRRGKKSATPGAGGEKEGYSKDNPPTRNPLDTTKYY